MSLFDEAVKKAKEINPNFDEDNAEDLDIMTKSFVLSQLETEHGKEIYESYLVKVVETQERHHYQRLFEQKKYGRQELIEARQKMLQLEKDIIERKMKVLREYMD